MRRLLVVLLIALSGVVLTEMPAHACRCVATTQAERATNAQAIFTGTIAASDAPSGRTVQQTVTYDVVVGEVYKGTVPAQVQVRTSGQPTACGLIGLKANRRYAFFATTAGTAYEINSCGGTRPADAAVVKTIEETVGTTGHPPTGAEQTGTESQSGSPTDARAVLTPVAGGEPTPFARLAAPGAALAIIGLLGLLLVTRLGRARQH